MGRDGAGERLESTLCGHCAAVRAALEAAKAGDANGTRSSSYRNR